jgi:hypothetical protein
MKIVDRLLGIMCIGGAFLLLGILEYKIFHTDYLAMVGTIVILGIGSVLAIGAGIAFIRGDI